MAEIRDSPLLMRLRPYSSQTHGQERVFPNSTASWYHRMSHGNQMAMYSVKEIRDDYKFWLSIRDPVTRKKMEEHIIQPYEIWPLILETIENYRQSWLDILAPENPEMSALSVMRILEDEVSWSELNTLTKSIPSKFKRTPHAWTTLDQLIPPAFEGELRHELMAFLTHVAKGVQCTGDPVNFIMMIGHLRFLRALLEVHHRFTVADLSPPQYLTILRSVSTHNETQERVISETNRMRLFSKFLYKVMEESPDWRGVALRYAKRLNQSGSVIVNFPVTSEMAKKSKKDQLNRFLLYSLGLHLRTHPRAMAFGLRRVIYLGNAHRWPHPMLTWSAYLGEIEDYPLHMQVMTMPPVSLKRAKRYLPSLLEIEWSARASNPQLFAHKKKEWSISTKRILRSLQREKPYEELRREFGWWRRNKHYQPSQEEARILDTTAARLNLAYLETKQGRTHWGVSEHNAITFLTRMKKLGALQTFYEINETRLPRPLFVIVNGSQNRVCSLTRSLLANSPSAVAYLANNWRTSIAIASLPKVSRDKLRERLPIEGVDNGLEIRCAIPESFQNYTHDLFQRLLNADGTWLDDVTGLISQVRSIPKEKRLDDLSEAHDIYVQSITKVSSCVKI